MFRIILKCFIDFFLGLFVYNVKEETQNKKTLGIRHLRKIVK